MKIRWIAIFLIGVSLFDVACAGWASAIGEFLGKASGKAVKVVDDVPIPKHTPDVAPVSKPSFEHVPATEANPNVAAQIGRVVARCKEEASRDDLRRQCEKKGEEMKLCLASEVKTGIAKEQAEKKCGLPAP